MSAVPINDNDLVEGQRLSVGGIRYKVVEALGRGGNSSVYLVQCLTGPHQGLLFAVKVFTRVDDATRLARFQVELEFLKKSQHPAVMLVYESGSHPVSIGDGTIELPYYVADYLPKTLRDAMRSGMSIVDKVAVSMQLISALAFLEKSDPVIVHRDVKPENIFIKGRSAVLGDFGLLKAIGDPDSVNKFSVRDLSRGIRHPRFYPTPELIEYAKGRISSVCPKSDVFQLGLVFSELFCGESPLKERDVYDEIELTELRRVPGAAGEIIRGQIERMLSFSIDRRPSATELFDQWDGVFRQVVDDARRLEGKAFG